MRVSITKYTFLCVIAVLASFYATSQTFTPRVVDSILKIGTVEAFKNQFNAAGLPVSEVDLKGGKQLFILEAEPIQLIPASAAFHPPFTYRARAFVYKGKVERIDVNSQLVFMGNLYQIGYSKIDSVNRGENYITTVYESSTHRFRFMDTLYNVSLSKKRSVFGDNAKGRDLHYYTDGQPKELYTLEKGIRNGHYRAFHPNGKTSKVTSYKDGLIDSVVVEYDTGYVKTAEYIVEAGKKNGYYKTFKQGKALVTAAYKNDTLDGRYEENTYDANGNQLTNIIGGYVEGRKSGRWETFNIKNGKRELKHFYTYRINILSGDFSEVKGDTIISGKYVNNEINGPYQKTDTEGHVFEEGWYTKGGRTGLWKFEFIDKDGERKKAERHYKDGKYHGEFKLMTMDGKMLQLGFYEEGRQEGRWIDYKNGKKIKVYSFENGQAHGDHEFFNEDGIKLVRHEYKRGKLASMSKYDVEGTFSTVYVEVLESEGDKHRLSATVFGDTAKTTGYVLTQKEPLAWDSYKKGTIDGEYVAKVDREVVTKGQHKNGKPTGKWEWIYFKQNVTVKREYDGSGNMTSEFYRELDTKEEFSGTLELYYADGKLWQEVKIRKGLRNGNTTFYDTNGEETRKVKYSDGVVKE